MSKVGEAGTLANIRLFGKEYSWVLTGKASKDLTKLYKKGQGIPVGELTVLASKKAVGSIMALPQSNAERIMLNKIGTAINLSKTAGFGAFAGGMGALALGAGIIGYLLGNSNNNQNTNAEMPVTTKPKEPTNTTNKQAEATTTAPKAKKPSASTTSEIAHATVQKNENKSYYPVSTGGYTWKGIVEAYYPDLVDKCNGQLFGNDGAIRALKTALNQCSEKDLVYESDIPATLNLPLEIDGVKINTTRIPEKEEMVNKGGDTDLKESGCKSTTTVYTVIDKKRNKQYQDPNLDTAIDSLKGRTGVKKYKLDFAS